MRKKHLAKTTFLNNTELQTIAFDVSEITGKHYFAISFYRGSNSTIFRVYSLELS